MIIRKFIAISLLAVAALCRSSIAFAEDRYPFMDTSRPSKPLDIGVHVGLGVSTQIQNYASAVPGCADFHLSSGLQSAFGATVEVPLRRYIAIGTGADFVISNNSWAMTAINSEPNTVSTLYCRNTYRAFEIPIYVSLRFNLGSRIIWTNEGGMYLSFGTGGRTRITSYTAAVNQLGQQQVTRTRYDHAYYNADTPILNGIGRNDVGIHLSTGLQYLRHWTLKAVMRYGFRNVARNYGVLDVNVHNLAFSFRLGYTF